MTATTPQTAPPWRVRWAVYIATGLAILAFPGAVRDIGLQLIHNTAHIFGMDGDQPVQISPTNPPVVEP